jgi:hypothetical protein
MSSADILQHARRGSAPFTNRMRSEPARSTVTLRTRLRASFRSALQVFEGGILPAAHHPVCLRAHTYKKSQTEHTRRYKKRQKDRQKTGSSAGCIAWADRCFHPDTCACNLVTSRQHKVRAATCVRTRRNRQRSSGRTTIHPCTCIHGTTVSCHLKFKVVTNLDGLGSWRQQSHGRVLRHMCSSAGPRSAAIKVLCMLSRGSLAFRLRRVVGMRGCS